MRYKSRSRRPKQLIFTNKGKKEQTNFQVKTKLILLYKDELTPQQQREHLVIWVFVNR